MLVLFELAWLNDHLFEKELFLRYTLRVVRERLTIFVGVLLSLLFLKVGCGI